MSMQKKLRLLVTEKTTELSVGRKYTFLVDGDADKSEISQMVASEYSVVVDAVNTSTQSSKSRRTRGGVLTRQRPRKAVVTLAPGNSIPLV